MGTINHSKSEYLYKQAVNVMPQAVVDGQCFFEQIGRSPVYIKKAAGAYLYDEDEHAYIDYVNAFGAGILGHANETVVRAISKAAGQGIVFGAPSKNEYILCNLIKEQFPSMEMMKFMHTREEAIACARTIASYQKKQNYVIEFTCKPGLHCIYNDVDSVRKVFEQYKGQIGAIIVEPVAVSSGVIEPQEGFLEFLRQITIENQALLVFDESITGYRLGLGGAQKKYNIMPDLTILGGIVGAGLPLAVCGGKRELMERESEKNVPYHMDTISLAAGIATIQELRRMQDRYKELEQYAVQLVDAWKNTFPNAKVNRVESLYSIFFTKAPVECYEQAAKTKKNEYGRMCSYMLDHHIYVPPCCLQPHYLSMAHTQVEVNQTCKCIILYAEEKKNALNRAIQTADFQTPSVTSTLY